MHGTIAKVKPNAAILVARGASLVRRLVRTSEWL